MRFNLDRLGPIVSDPREAQLAELAVERGWTDAERVRQALQKQKETRRPLEEILVGESILTADQVGELRGLLPSAQPDLAALARLAAEDPSRRVGRYVLLEEVGSGGAAVVWKAWQPDLGRAVAVKLLRPGEHSEAFLKRFMEEGRVMASLSHPHVAQVYDVGESPRGRYIAMEFIEGRSPSRQDLDVAAALRIVRDVATGVAYAHSRGVIHRDIKPSNIVVRKDGHAFIMDFGLAKRAEDDLGLTRSGTILGTPYYMAPEQALGRMRDVDARSDVYSLGATLYELMTGIRPFSAGEDSMAAVLRRVVESDPTPPRRLRADLAIDVERVILKAMEKAKDRRYASAAEFADELTRVLAGEPVRAGRPSVRRFVWRKVRRHPAASTAAAVAAVALGALALLRFGDYLDRQRQEAARLAAEARSREERIRRLEAYRSVQQMREALVLRRALERPDEAVQQRDRCSAILREYPDLWEARLLRADVQWHLVERAAAHRDYDRVLRDGHSSIPPVRGRALTALSRALDALLMHALGLPLHPRTLEWLASARADLATVLRALKMEVPEERWLGECMDLLERAAKQGSEPLRKRLVDAAHQKANRGSLRLDEALMRPLEPGRQNPLFALMNNALSDAHAAWTPGSTHMRVGVAEWLAASGDPLRILSEVVEKRPSYETAFVIRGLLLLSRGDTPGALRDFDRAVELDPELNGVLAERIREAGGR